MGIDRFTHPGPDRLVANIGEDQFGNVAAINPAVENVSVVFEVLWDVDVRLFGYEQCV